MNDLLVLSGLSLYSELAINLRVPHISLVFREMWDTTVIYLKCVGSRELQVEQRIPKSAEAALRADAAEPCLI